MTTCYLYDFDLVSHFLVPCFSKQKDTYSIISSLQQMPNGYATASYLLHDLDSKNISDFCRSQLAVNSTQTLL